MATVICPGCGLKVRAEDRECFACGTPLPRAPRIEPKRYEGPVPVRQSDYSHSGYGFSGSSNDMQSSRYLSRSQNTPPEMGSSQGSIPAREATQAYSGLTYTRDTLPPPPPITLSPSPTLPSPTTTGEYGSNTAPQRSTKPEKLKNSTMSVLALIFAIFVFPVGLILGIIDLSKKDKSHKHGLSIAAIVIAGLLVLFALGNSNKDKDTSAKTESEPAVEEAVEADAEPEATVEVTDDESVQDDSDAEEQIAEVPDEHAEEASEEPAPADNEPVYEQTDAHVEFYTNSIGTIELHSFVEIENKGNSGIYLRKCTFDFEDNDGHLLQSEKIISSCPDIVAPGEKGYFYYTGSLNEGVSTENGVNLVPNYKVEIARGDITEYEVTDTELKEGTFGSPTVTGRVTNNTDQDDSYCYVNIIFYDSEGKVLAFTGTSVTDLTAGSTQSFDCTAFFISDSVTMDDIADYKVLARKGYMQF